MAIFSGMTIRASVAVIRCNRWFACLAVVAARCDNRASSCQCGQRRHEAGNGRAKSVVSKSAVADDSAASRATSPKSTSDKRSTFCNGVRLQDEIDVINTRNVGCSSDPEVVCAKACGSRHTRSAMSRALAAGSRPIFKAFLAFNPTEPTVFFVHGNQITAGDAKCEGLAVYHAMILHGSDAPPIRFVIFSWPSAKVGGLLQDVRIKAARTGPAGYQLAWVVDQMPTETPISLRRLQFRRRIITGGLHVLAGGSLGGPCSLAERASSRPSAGECDPDGRARSIRIGSATVNTTGSR